MKVYIMTPAKVETGGVELLHQLAFVLNLIGIEAYIVYFNTVYDGLEPIEYEPLDSYKKYNIKTETDISVMDRPENIAIIGEQNLEFLKEFNQCKKAIWWMSVDGYLSVLRLVYHVPEKKLNDPKVIDWYGIKGDKSLYHLVQSAYAIDFVSQHFEPAQEKFAYLSDYVNDIYLEGQMIDDDEKKDIVVFNPKKGYDRLRPIMEKTIEYIKWVPIIDMTPAQVRATLNLAKVYIDFGFHPGKDRIPRESAMCGCCVITNRRGAAAYYEDVTIPDEYKFNDNGEDDDAVIKLICDIFANYKSHKANFDYYRECILKEKEAFIRDAMNFFLPLANS